MKNRMIALFVCLSVTLLAQAPVNQVFGPPPVAVTQIYDYNGGTDLVYIGAAFSDQQNPINGTVTVSAASNANPVSFTATGHGFDYQSGATTTPTVCITGATLTWTGINGCWIATPTSANAFTIAVDSTAFGALTGTLVVTTRGPRTTKPVWSIQKNVYASHLLIWSGWASLPAGAGSVNPVSGSVAYQFIWANRASLGYQ